MQQTTGHDDSVEAMTAYLQPVTPQPDPVKIGTYCQHSVAHFEWPAANGVEFERSNIWSPIPSVASSGYWLTPLTEDCSGRRAGAHAAHGTSSPAEQADPPRTCTPKDI
ncbi:hypothetical protein ACLMAJ_22770 [Nocardia sp. KC 131]|uniref:hypothetical protein n=1 Tax=Nocardia arseniciresistens TaxID=3392119 RepID=UPI00398F360B